MPQPIFLFFWHPDLHMSTGTNETCVSQGFLYVGSPPGIYKTSDQFFGTFKFSVMLLANKG